MTIPFWCDRCRRVMVEALPVAEVWCRCGRRCKPVAPPVRLPKTPQARGRVRAEQTALPLGAKVNF